MQVKVAIDLGKLAVKRCDEAFGSVAQLLQGPDVYGLAIVMAAHFIEVAAHDLQDGMEHQNGERPPYSKCLHYTVSEIFHILEIQHEVVETKK